MTTLTTPDRPVDYYRFWAITKEGKAQLRDITPAAISAHGSTPDEIRDDLVATGLYKSVSVFPHYVPRYR